MEVRENRVFYETYAVSLSEDDLKRATGLVSYVKQYASDPEKLFAMVNWGALRSPYGVTPKSVNALKRGFNTGTPPDTDTGVFFQVNVTGAIRFYRPQVSSRRQAMATPAAKTTEKQRLIQMMKRSGRAGARGFNWDWTFRDQ
jgi:hypothetical protein